MSSVLKHLCPVCGFLLDFPPRDFNICPSCGTEFDADTVEYTIQELRQSWFDRGLEWTSPVIPKPENFNPVEQLSRLQAQGVTGLTSSSEQIGESEPLKFKPQTTTSAQNAVSRGRLELRRA